MKPFNKILFIFSKDYIKKIFIALFWAFITILFLLNSKINPLTNSETYTDSSVFKTVAMMISNGYKPYLDSFDHKGPLIYLINYFGRYISVYSGTWVIECVFMYMTFIGMYMIARLKCNRIISIIVTLFSTVLLHKYYEGGNFVEKYALLFIVISLYIFTDYFINGTLSSCRLIICGFSLSCVLLLRPNMIAVWIVFCCVIFINLISSQKYNDLLKCILNFSIGVLIPIALSLIYLISNGILQSFWSSYIEFNMGYSSAEVAGSILFSRINAFTLFFCTIPVYISTIASLVLSFCSAKNQRIINICYFLTIILTCLFIAISGRDYGHYGMILLPCLVFPSAEALNYLQKNLGNIKSFSFKKHTAKNILCIIMLTVTVAYTLSGWSSSVKNAIKVISERNISHISNTVTVATNLITENTNPEDKISVYGNWDIIYLRSNRMHATRYSYQYPIGEVSPQIIDEYFQQLETEMPKIIVVAPTKYDSKIKQFLQDNNYNLIWTENTDEDINNPNTIKIGALLWIR